MTRLLPILLFALLSPGAAAFAQAEEAKAGDDANAAANAEAAADADPPPGVVITAEDASPRCMLPLIVTAVDGRALAEPEPNGRFEFAAGKHSISGYGAGDPSACASFASHRPEGVQDGERLGESTLEWNVEAGKEYYLAVDIRSDDPKRWKIVAWKVRH